MRAQLIRPDNAPNFCFEVINTDTGKSIEFVHSDWDYASLASNFGWVSCECGATDGTIDCPHKKTGEMLADAYDFLCEHEGETCEWPE